MKKFIILFIVNVWTFFSIKPVFAQINYDSFCTPQVCWEQAGGSPTLFYDQCQDMGSYCAGTGNVEEMYCTCREGGDGYVSGCSCDLNFNRGDNLGPSCAYTPNTWGVCLISGATCDSNDFCQAYEGGAYPTDVCRIDSSNNCKIQEIPWITGCCGSSSDPTPTSVPPTSVPPSPTNTPIPTETPRQFTINVNLIRSGTATYNVADNSCSGAGDSFTEETLIYIEYPPGAVVDQSLTSDGSESFTLDNVTAGDQYNIRAQTVSAEHACTCPGGCVYALTIPAIGTDSITRNIYFYNYTDTWFQAFGGSVFAGSFLNSIVPQASCVTPDCLAGVFVPKPSLDALTSGFPFLNVTDTDSIQTHSEDDSNLANIHLSGTGQRSTAQSADAFALNYNPLELSYDYFYQMAENSAGSIITPPNGDLTSWRTSGLIPINQTNYFKIEGDFTIDQSNHFTVSNNETVVVFIDNGDLIIDDNTGVGDKIISVDRKTAAQAGGFLAFFVDGDIIINETVGEPLDVGNPLNITAVTVPNSHLDGVYFSNQQIIVEEGSSYPNKKLIVAGTLIGRNNILLGRQADDGTPATESYKIHNTLQALENFIYRADLLINWPEELKSSIINWQEVAPKSFN